jgi:hypothetical protein
MARPAGDGFEDFAWALTHGGGGDVRGRIGEERRLGFAGRWRGFAVRGGVIGVRGRGTLTAALARPSGLVAAMLLAVGCRPIASPGHPAAPASRGALAGRATVAGLGSARQEPAFTSLEQAAAAGGMPPVRTGGLTRHQGGGRLGTAHGRVCSRVVRRREGGTSRRHSAPTAGMTRVGDRAARTRQISCRDSCLPRRERDGGAKAAIGRWRLWLNWLRGSGSDSGRC